MGIPQDFGISGTVENCHRFAEFAGSSD